MDIITEIIPDGPAGIWVYGLIAIGVFSFIAAVFGAMFNGTLAAESALMGGLIVGAVFFTVGIPVLIVTIGFAHTFFTAFAVVIVATIRQ